MAHTIHLIFEFVKSAILAFIYAYLLLPVIQHFSSRHPFSYIYQFVLHKRLHAWLLTSTLIFLALWEFQSSYWGDHGLGDYARIPIGDGRAVEQINGSGCFITPYGNEYETLRLKSYHVDGGVLIGYVDRPQYNEKEIARWDLETNEVEFFDSIEEVTKEDLEFTTFQEHYSSYWHGWRFWLLP